VVQEDAVSLAYVRGVQWSAGVEPFSPRHFQWGYIIVPLMDAC